jgi:peptidyl-prolyl cis-trans isomerase B (cyclophilin B)
MKKVIIFLILSILLIGVIFGMAKMTGESILNTNKTEKVQIETNYGNIIVELYPNKAPITVKNFKKYVKEDFYSDTIFHRVIDGFMIQGGEMTIEGVLKETKKPIILESNNGLKNERGTIAMARTYILDSATSQFFINTKDNEFLDYGVRDEGYAVFGRVIEGMEVVDKISKVETDQKDKPLENVIIKSIKYI